MARKRSSAARLELVPLIKRQVGHLDYSTRKIAHIVPFARYVGLLSLDSWCDRRAIPTRISSAPAWLYHSVIYRPECRISRLIISTDSHAAPPNGSPLLGQPLDWQKTSSIAFRSIASGRSARDVALRQGSLLPAPGLLPHVQHRAGDVDLLPV